MSVIKLIIADENQNYAKGVVLYLQEEYGQAFNITCFTQRNVLLEHLNKFEAADILLIDQNLFNEHIPHKHIKSVVVLMENTKESVNNNSIYKYQKADRIAKHLLETYERCVAGGAAVHRIQSKCKIISVYSTTGAAGKTTIAYNLAQQYAMQSQKVLFISLETYTSLSIFKNSEAAQGLIYLLYLIKNRAQNLQLKLNAIKVTEMNTNIHFIERENNVLEYKDMKIEDIKLLVDFLRNQSGYDAVILDLDSSINEFILGIFKYCDGILNVQCNDAINKLKQEDFKKQIPKINNLLEVDINRKLICVKNKSENVSSNENKEFGGCAANVEIPVISSEFISQGVYFAEMAHFKQLYDVLENTFSSKGNVNDIYKG